MKEFKTIATFTFVHEILVLKSILEHEGIRYFYQKEHLIGIDPLASYAYGGIKLKIHPNDFERVQNILDELNNNLKIV